MYACASGRQMWCVETCACMVQNKPEHVKLYIVGQTGDTIVVVVVVVVVVVDVTLLVAFGVVIIIASFSFATTCWFAFELHGLWKKESQVSSRIFHHLREAYRRW